MSSTLGPWTVLATQRLLQTPWVTVDCQHVRTPGGKDIPSFYMRATRDSCLIVAVDKQRRVPLVRQYKHGLGRVLREFPAGYLEPGELPLLCAQRELREETGCEAREWMRLGVLAREPHYSSSVLHVFLARGAMRVGEPQPDETEELEAEWVPGQSITGLLTTGEMPSLYCVAAWALAREYLCGF